MRAFCNGDVFPSNGAKYISMYPNRGNLSMIQSIFVGANILGFIRRWFGKEKVQRVVAYGEIGWLCCKAETVVESRDDS